MATPRRYGGNRQNNAGDGSSSFLPVDDASAAMELPPSSSEIFQGSFPDLPISYHDLKPLLHTGLMPEARLFWWPLLPRVTPKSTLRSDPKIKAIATALYLKTKARHFPEGEKEVLLLPGIDISLNHADNIQTVYSERVGELLSLLSVLYDLPEPGLLTPLLGILVRMIPSIDLCLQVCFDILSRREWFISLSSVEHRLNLFSFKELLKNNLPDEYRALEDAGALLPASLDLIFVHFFQPLLPFQSVARVLDCYLLEGVSVLFNLGLGLIFLNRDLVHHLSCTPPLNVR
jgi:hypothetical protein